MSTLIFVDSSNMCMPAVGRRGYARAHLCNFVRLAAYAPSLMIPTSSVLGTTALLDAATQLSSVSPVTCCRKLQLGISLSEPNVPSRFNRSSLDKPAAHIATNEHGW